MNLPKFIAPILTTSFVTLIIALRLTGVVQYYSIPTSANEPNLMVGSRLFASNLKSHKNGNFVCYTFNDKRSGNHVRVHRLTGIQGDTIELKKGILLINGQNFDKDFDVQHYYSIPNNKPLELRTQKVISQASNQIPRGNAMTIPLTDKVAIKHGLSEHRLYDPFNQADHGIKKRWKKDWTSDDFGPIVIPAGKIFVLGDSRHRSEDSRFIGFIDESDIVGTVLFK